MNFFDQFTGFLHQQYPLLLQKPYSDLPLSPLLISSHVTRLPKSVWNSAQQLVQVVFKMRQSKSYVSDNFDPGNNAILMSYDFHLSPNGELKLIEINTNAAFG